MTLLQVTLERCLTRCDLLQVTQERCLTRCDVAAGNTGAGPVAEEREDVLCLTRCDTAAGNTYV